MANQSTSHKSDEDIKKEISEMLESGKPILDFLTNFPIKSSNNEGVVYVVNVKFEEHSWLKFDDENIKVLFEKMGFRVEMIQENTFKKIQDRLEIIRNSDEVKNARMFIMFLLSYGVNNYLLDIDHERMDINAVFVKPFLSKNCSALVNKPKLFFIDADREDTRYKGIPMEPHQAATEVFKFFCTLEGGLTFYNKFSGSNFIRCFLLTIANFYEKRSVISMAQTSTSILSSIPIKDYKDYRQIPIVESTLSKEIFLHKSQDQIDGKSISENIKDAKIEIGQMILSGEDNLKFDINYNIERPNKNMDVYYPCASKPRGVVYVWNIEIKREGSEFDVENIEVLFKKMGYSVEVIVEDTLEEIQKKLEIIKTDKNKKLEKADMFIMFLMSHGTNQLKNNDVCCHKHYLVDSKNQKMNVKDVFVEPFKSVNCSALENKPKMFFISACRGEKPYYDSYKETSFDQPQPSTHPDTDIFIFNATTQSNTSLRYPSRGTLFIRCLLLTIAKFCHQKSLDFMMKFVNSVISLHSYPSKRGTYKQVSSAETTLTMDVFFNPYENK